MRILVSALVCAAIFGIPATAESQARPVHTFSIVARDAATGQIGVAVQSHWFSVAQLYRGQSPESVP